jgi:hypothetical protein
VTPERAEGFNRAMDNRARQVASAALDAYDLSDVVATVDETLVGAAHGARVETVGGDFFTSVPNGADAYVLSSILHDWDDPAAVDIPRTVRRAMDPAGKVVVIETVVPEGDTPHIAKLLDVIMLALTGGRERTDDEYAKLLRWPGWRMSRPFRPRRR